MPVTLPRQRRLRWRLVRSFLGLSLLAGGYGGLLAVEEAAPEPEPFRLSELDHVGNDKNKPGNGNQSPSTTVSSSSSSTSSSSKTTYTFQLTQPVNSLLDISP